VVNSPAFRDWVEAGFSLSSGAVAGFPTETVFGLGCDPRNPSAVSELVKLKGREKGKGLPLVASSASSLDSLSLDETESSSKLRLSLQEEFWPGPLTIVIQLKKTQFADGVAAPDGSIAVRVSGHNKLSELAGATGGFLIATSANLAGEPTAETGRQFEQYFPAIGYLDDFNRPGSKFTEVTLRSASSTRWLFR